MKYLRIEEVARLYGVSRDDLERLEREQLIEIKRTLEDETVVSTEDADKARLVKLLVEELDVNLAGAEVILHMRSDMIAMQRQFGKILETLVSELRQGFSR